MALTLLTLPLVLLILGFPIYLSLMVTTLVVIFGFTDLPPNVIQTLMFSSLDSFPLLAVPFFIFAGDVMARGGIAQRLIELIMSVVGGIRGSLAVATIGSASAFGAMSGSSVACVAAIGKLTLPALEQGGYGRRFSVSMITATGVIDVIIPPSIPMILYGVTSQQSVTHLFLAGIVPGLIIACGLAVYVVARAVIQKTPLTDPVHWRELLARARAGIWAVFAPVLILGGIYGGIFTPTEAAGVACVYSVIVSVYIYRELDWKDIWQIGIDCSGLIAQILIIVVGAGAYSWLITTSGFPTQLVNWIDSLNLSTWSLLLTINGVLLLVGSALEPPAAILVLTPLLLPLANKAGLDPIHFGLIVTVNLAIGLFLPPFGLNLFASHALFKEPLPSLYRGVLPFLVVYLLGLMLITYVPAVTLVPLQFLK
jgi:C4-dicarboxylate transporter, DctM subunit